jgi:hypothetical protein
LHYATAWHAGSSAGSRPPSARAAAAAADATPQEQTVILKMSEWRTVQRQMQELKEANEVLEGRNQVEHPPIQSLSLTIGQPMSCLHDSHRST